LIRPIRDVVGKGLAMKLSILDQSPVSEGSSPADALHNTIELAKLGDRLGYARYWIAEHHAMPALASPAPEILIARVAAETERIRVGSGAVLLPHYSPLKVAETFRMLHALHPGRIDLGLGRAPGGTPLEAFALRRQEGEDVNDFPRRLLELMAFLDGSFPDSHPFSRILVSPAMPGGPELWLLGSSLWSASAAAQLGLPYAFAHFIEPEPTREALAYYRKHFVPSRHASEPRVILGIGGICAQTDAEAERLASGIRLLRWRVRRGELAPIPSPDDALAALAGVPDLPSGSEFPRDLIGDPVTVRDRLMAMATALGVDEVMIVTIVHDHQARLESYRLLAEAFGLGGG
jgi:luciferase family oxidoreductase group 1